MTKNASAAVGRKERSAAKTDKAMQGRVSIDCERCKGCGYCVTFCPLGVLGMSSRFNGKGYHYPVVILEGKCSGCDLCGMYCPDFAIHGSRQPKRDSTKE